MDQTFSDRLRGNLYDLIVCPTCGRRRWTMRAIAGASGIPESTLRRFMKGGELRLLTVDRLVAFLRENDVEVKV